jgi:hypothetical protein
MNTPIISSVEWRRVAWFAALVCALVLLPYALGWATQTDDQRFSGAVIAADDIQSYLGKMRLGARGIWDFTLFYTPEAHDAVPGVFLFYIAAGQLMRPFYAATDPALTPALVVLYHALRIACTLLLIFVLYRFMAHFLRAPAQRMTALILSVLGGGFGWLLIFLPGGADWLGSLPPDIYIPEGFGFLIPLALPHLALARALLLVGFVLIINALSKVERGGGEVSRVTPIISALLAGLCWALVGVIVPFYLAVIYCLLAAWGVGLIARNLTSSARHVDGRHEWRPYRILPLTLLLYGGIAAGITLPVFIYYALAFAGNPVFAAWSAQNLLAAPHPLQYLVAYSIFLALGAFAIRWAWRRGRARAEYVLLLAWVMAAALLVYLPINVQRRMSEAVIVPLAILAAHGLALFLRTRVRRRMRGRARAAVLLLASLTSLVLIMTTTLGALSSAPPIHLPRAKLDAFAWLDANTPSDTRILAVMPTGNLIPAYTHLRPYVGHGPETMGAIAKEAETERFYADAMSADERAALFASVDIRYVFYGDNERALATMPDAPAWADGLTLVYEAGGVQVYAVESS